jgi:hypothetical protein
VLHSIEVSWSAFADEASRMRCCMLASRSARAGEASRSEGADEASRMCCCMLASRLTEVNVASQVLKNVVGNGYRAKVVDTELGDKWWIDIDEGR